MYILYLIYISIYIYIYPIYFLYIYRHYLNTTCPLGHHHNGFVFVQKLRNNLRGGCTYFCGISL